MTISNAYQTLTELVSVSEGETKSTLIKIAEMLRSSQIVLCGFCEGGKQCAKRATSLLKFKSKSHGFNWLVQLPVCNDHTDLANFLSDPVDVQAIRFPFGDETRCEQQAYSENSVGGNQKANGLPMTIPAH